MSYMIARFDIPDSWPSDLHEFSLVGIESSEGVDVLHFQSDYFGDLHMSFRGAVWDDPAAKDRMKEWVSMGEKMIIDVLEFCEANGGFKLATEVVDFSTKPARSEFYCWRFNGELIAQRYRELEH